MKYLFYNYYKLFQIKGTYTSLEFAASNLFFIFIFFNLTSLALIARIINLADIFSIKIYYLIGFSFLLLILTIYYFSNHNRTNKILEYFERQNKKWTFYFPFWIYVISSFFAPLILLVYV